MEYHLFNALAAATGLFIFGEAIIILSALYILGIGDYSWQNRKNALLITFDIITGLLLIITASQDRELVYFYPLMLIIVLSITSHAYRTWERITMRGNRFCTTPALYLFNLLKLTASVALFIGGLFVENPLP